MTIFDKLFNKPETDLDRLINQLTNKTDVFARVSAAEALGGHIDIKAILALKDALKDARPGVVKSTGSGKPVQINLMNPSEMRRSDIDAVIRKALDSGASVIEVNLIGRGSVQDAAASSLIQLSSKINDDKAIAPLLKALGEGDKYTRRAIFVTLCRLSAQTGNDTGIRSLIHIQSEIDRELMGQPLVGAHTAKDELLLLMVEMKKYNKAEPFVACLSSSEPAILIFGIATLLEMRQKDSIISALKNADMKKSVFNSVFDKIEEMDSDFAFNSLLNILQNGTSSVRPLAARKLSKSSDSRAVAALSEWKSILEKALVGKDITCHRCGRKPSQELDGGYWCSWCGDGFDLGDVYAHLQNKGK